MMNTLLEHVKNSKITQTNQLFINGKQFSFKEGESILEVARRNNIYIPTLCHLPKLLPVGACRMCMVEEDNGNIIASCKSLATQNIKVYTHTQKLQNHRQEIMKLLCINHPLECGVCDKSGECELQDKVLETKIDFQTFGAQQRHDDFVVFKNKIYDESLCIMCERCARTCNQIVGNNYLRVIPGGYNSKIGVNESNYCEDCDECVSVCPTGAMISQRFQYTSNAWELEKTPSLCNNCSMGCYSVYESKNTNQTTHIAHNKKIYRITSQMEFSQLCHSGRHNFANSPVCAPDDLALKNAIKAFKNAKAIKLGTQISNEEAFVLNYLKHTLNVKLYCEDARVYQEFISILKATSNAPIHKTANTIKNADVCISLASFIFDESPLIKSQIAQAILLHKTRYIYMHPIPDDRLKAHQHIQYEVQTELGVLALMLSSFLKNNKTDTGLTKFICDLDLGYLSSESNIAEEELEKLSENFSNAQNPVILVGHELLYHPQSSRIAQMLGLIEKYTPAKIILLAPSGNTIGISLICNLDRDEEDIKQNIIGYKTKGDFVLNEVFNEITYENNPNFTPQTDFVIPSMLQIEGSITNMDYRLLPIVASLPYEGYDICNIAQHFGFEASSLIELTNKLPQTSGFKNIAYDDLDNYFDQEGKEHRGYDLKPIVFTNTYDLTFESIEFLPESNGSLLFIPKQSGNFMSFEEPKIIASKQFGRANKLQNNSLVSFKLNDKIFTCNFICEDYLKGMVAILNMGKYFSAYEKYPYQKISSWSADV